MCLYIKLQANDDGDVMRESKESANKIVCAHATIARMDLLRTMLLYKRRNAAIGKLNARNEASGRRERKLRQRWHDDDARRHKKKEKQKIVYKFVSDFCRSAASSCWLSVLRGQQR